MLTVAALFVEAGGVYSTMPSVDCWDKDRDARRYAGPHAVVTHPPCHLWTNFAALNFKRWGGEHNRPGNDGGCFASALASVRRWSGVLEHPAESNAWAEHGLVAPSGIGWQLNTDGSWVCEVWQSAYGHKARKRTWLYYYGSVPPEPVLSDRKSGSHQCGWFDRNKPTLSKSEASRTPIAFAEYLVRLARAAAEARKAA